MRMSGLHQSVHLALEAHPRLAERSAGGLPADRHRQRGRWLKLHTLYDNAVLFRSYCPSAMKGEWDVLSSTGCQVD